MRGEEDLVILIVTTPHPAPLTTEQLIPTNVISGFATVSCSALSMDVAHSLAIILPYYDSCAMLWSVVRSTSTVESHESRRGSVLQPFPQGRGSSCQKRRAINDIKVRQGCSFIRVQRAGYSLRGMRFQLEPARSPASAL